MGSELSKLTRRTLLDKTWRMFAAASVGAAGRGLAAPGSGSGSIDRAIVCIYLHGGNDSNNLLVPMQQYDSYARARASLALPGSSLLTVKDSLTQDQYGFHPAVPELRDLFESRSLAVVANVGYFSNALPDLSMRHSDPGLSYFPGAYALPSWAANLAGATPTSHTGLITGFPSSSLAVAAPGSRISKTAADAVVESTRKSSGALGGFPDTSIGQQLRQVAGLLSSASQHGISRPIFLVPMSGFGTISDQMPKQAVLLRELSMALAKFYQVTADLGLAQRVTTYTDSECNRTLQPNRANGTDAAWGGHQLVFGGSVLGGQIYGKFPVLKPGGPDDAAKTGIWLPSTSKDQYAATFASWHGVSYSDLPSYLPGVANLASRTLNFLT
jgi:uncharacterized protein (DUF1501 family)